MAKRYVISIRRRTGLGDHLICLAAAWKFARDTGRVLVADWRFSPYTLIGKDNLFPLCFEAPDELAGVPFIGGKDVGDISPQKEDGGPGFSLPWRRKGVQRVKHREALAHILAARDLSPERLIFDSCLNHGVASLDDVRAFLSALKPIAEVRGAVAAFRASLPVGPLIGLHMRHGNGARILDYERYWSSCPLAIERCVNAVNRARTRLGTDATVLLCTDHIPVEDAIRDRIPEVVIRRKMRREAGEGELHLWRGAPFVKDDALMEMLILAQCDALIRYAPASFFSFYGAVMKPRREPVAAHIQALQRPWDPTDILSPALLL